LKNIDYRGGPTEGKLEAWNR